MPFLLQSSLDGEIRIFTAIFCGDLEDTFENDM